MPANCLPVPHLEQSADDPAFPAAPQTIPVDDFLLAWAEFDNRYAAITRR